MVKLVAHDLEFILKQIKIAEAHAAGGDLAQLIGEAGAAGDVNGTPLQPHLLPYGLRTVDGSYNNLFEGREEWGASGKPFVPLVDPDYVNEGDDEMMFGTPVNPVWLTNNDYTPGSATSSPMLMPGTVVDADPRIISNLIVDQTSKNPFATMVYEEMLAEGKNATRTELRDADGNVVTHATAVRGPNGEVLAEAGSPVFVYTFENIAPDIGDSAPYNSMFTLFGQFFDHGLDLVAKGGNGTVYIPLSPDDPLYNPDSPHTNFMAMTRASRDEDGEVAANVTTPWVDQNQTYTSHASHQVFLREYVMHEGRPVATGNLLNGDRGLPTWADVKEQARELLGIDLTDADVGLVPMLRTDPYGEFVRGPNGLPQLLAAFSPDGTPIYVEGSLSAPVNPSAIQLPVGTEILGAGGATLVVTAGMTVSAARTGNAFLDDIAHAAVPVSVGGVLQADADDALGYVGGFNTRGQQTAYDNEMLDAHYITGDGRGNENVGLSSIHHVFHSEHNHVVQQTKDVIIESGNLAFINEWLLEPIASLDEIDTPEEIAALVWNGERLFQAGRFTTEMEYQHLVFEEFGRKMQPDIDAFLFEPSADVNPAIFAEFAHAVYRFGHSMLNQDIERLVENQDGSFSFDNITLFEGFLNPLALGAVDENGNVIIDHEAAAGAIIRGMTRQGGNEIDEFVTDVLRNQLVGIPLDLAALNIARGRDTGLPTLNEARAQFYQAAGQDSQLKPYTSWTDFALNLQNSASIVNFIAAYGTHPLIAAEETIEGKRAAAMAIVFGSPQIIYGDPDDPTDDRLAAVPADRLDFLNATGAYAGDSLGGLNDIDLWIGGLAEKKMDFGGMLGSTFAFVFELQMENLQEGDRFYYLSRVQGLNLLNELENNSLTKMIMRNTDLGEDSTALPGNIFSTPDFTLEMDISKQVGADPTFANATLQALSPLVERKDTDGDGDIDELAYNGGDHVVIGGTAEDDRIVAGEGDDTIWGRGGNDTLEAGYGVDHVHGGDGDDIITNAGTDIGAADFLHGEAGNDVIHGGSGMALIFGNEGNDFIIAGPDGKHIVGGLGNDFVRGGDGIDFVMGNEGSDWLEGGGRFDTLSGENSELMFNSSIIGHDVLNGNGSDTDYDAESGDDIMFQNEGIQRSNGMAGFDWAIHKGDGNAANSDLGIPLFATQEAFILRDRFDLVEGLSGWVHDDTLTGRISPTNARAELQNTAAIPGPDSPIDSFSNALLQKNVALIDGLDALVAHKVRIPVVDAEGNPVLDANGNPEMIVLDTADASDILLGGGGSDVITGLGGDDIIDGDKWLNVRIRINDANGNEIGSADGMTTKVFDAAGNELFGGRTLDALMFDRTVNPGELQIVREILDGDVENTGLDVAVYTDVVENYTFTRNADGSVTVEHTGFDDDDGEDENGEDIPEETLANRFSDGTDRLFNIERLRFSDGNGGTVEFDIDDLVVEPNSPATGAPVISDATPTEGDLLTVSLAGVTDADGMPATGYAYQWQYLNGTTWTDIPGANDPTFTPNDPNWLAELLGDISEIGSQLRVEVTFTDNEGNVETVYSTATAAVAERTGQVWSGSPFFNNTFNGGTGDDIATGVDPVNLGFLGTYGGNDTLNGNGGEDILRGLGGNDALNGGAGNDTLDGGAGNDDLNGGADNDVIAGGGGTDTIIQASTDGRDLVDGGAGTDTYQLHGVTGAETFTIYSRAAAQAAITGVTLAASTEIVVARNGVVIAELDNIEEIRVNSLQVTSPDGSGGGDSGGDTIQVVGDFTGTSLNYSTITIDGFISDDVIDISALQSAHRIVFRSNGGNDVIVGTLRPDDVIELPPGSNLDDYELIDNGDGTVTLTGPDHSVTFAAEGEPVIDIADPSGGYHHDDDDDDDDDDDHDNDDDDACGCDDDDDEGAVPVPPVSGGSIAGTVHGDMLTGTAAGDLIFGLAGTDYIVAGAGADVVRADEGDDFVYGEAGRDVIFAGDGDDDVFGGSGNDMVYGEAGADRLFGDGGNDLIDAGTGDDTVSGGAGNDLFVGKAGDGSDTYDGGAGIDTLDLGSLSGAVAVDLGTGVGGRGSVTGSPSGTDTLYGVENVTTGSGDDVIEASIAVNIIDGGDGEDVFVFGTAAAADGDTILGFEAGDTIDLSGIDADTGTAGHDQFMLVSGQASTAPGQIVVTHESREDGDVTVVSGNTGGDEDPEFRIEIAGTHTLGNSDFNL